MKNKRLWIIPGAIVLMSAAFLLLSFRIAVSDLQVIPRIMATKFDHYPDRLRPNDKISLVFTGEGPLVDTLQNALMEKWDPARMGQLALERERRSTYPNPVLDVQVGRPDLIWTPFFATCQFSIRAKYATNGDPNFTETLDAMRIYLRSSDPSVVDLINAYEGSDRSMGLISRLGYHQYLADYFAQQIVDVLKNLYNIQDPGGG